MSADTITTGYPVHRVATYCRWANQHGALFTDYTTACGLNDAKSGHLGVFGAAGNARRLELCAICFPGRDYSSYFPAPVENPTREAD